MHSPSLRDLNLSLEELKEIAQLLARKKGIKDYQSMSNERLLNALISSKSVKKSEKPSQSFRMRE